MSSWLILAFAGFLEVIWAVGIKYTENWTKLTPSLLVIIVYTLCGYLLSVAMKTLPIGTAYAVWVGMGTVGITIWGIIFFGESVSLIKLTCIGFILLGVIGLKLSH